MFELIINGLESIFGTYFFIGLMFLVCFMLILISRGVGITALIGMFFFSVYLFSNNTLGLGLLLPASWWITILLLIGLFIGFLVYMVFVR